MASLDDVKRVLSTVDPKKVVVNPDGTITITDPVVGQKLKALVPNAPEGGGINVGGCDC